MLNKTNEKTNSGINVDSLETFRDEDRTQQPSSKHHYTALTPCMADARSDIAYKNRFSF